MRAELTEGERGFLGWARVARLATLGPDGPHVVPVSPVLDGDELVFATEAATAKVRNMRSDPRVALVVDDYVEDWSALRQVAVRGTARIETAGPAWERGRSLLYAKFQQYEGEAPIVERRTAIVFVRVDEVSSAGF